ncbi:MAG: hypothetical protein JSV80_15980, partial [Acidobacteriota bacterium]
GRARLAAPALLQALLPTGASSLSQPPNGGDASAAPYVIEKARSSRSRCKTCRRTIPKDGLRIGLLIEGPYGTGYLWHHLGCAARRLFDRVEEAYELKAWEQAKAPPGQLPSLDELRKLRDTAEQSRQKRAQLPYVQVAPSGRAKCKHCEQLIDKGALRVVLGREVRFGDQVRVGPIAVHPRCVAAELQADDCATRAEGLLDALRENSQAISAEQIDAVAAEIGDLD